MDTKTIHAHQEILEQFKEQQVDIEYSRFLSDKSEYTIVIENKQHFVHWSQMLEKTLSTIHQSTFALDKVIEQDKEHEVLLGKLEAAIDELIHLQTEITASCAHKSDLMEGRYLIDHAVGGYLDQLNQHINEYRYQLNQLLFICNEDKTEKPVSLPLTFKKEVEAKAFDHWLSRYQDS